MTRREQSKAGETQRPFTAASGALAAAVLGLSCGLALKPTPAESGLPRPPQLMLLTDGELVAFEAAPPRVWWPSVPVDRRA